LLIKQVAPIVAAEKARNDTFLGGLLANELDAIDTKILDLIQRDASLSVAEIADRVGLSSSPCWRRIKRMEEQKIISGRVTLLNREAVGLDFQVYASVKLALPTRENLQRFEDAVSKLPEVMECATVTGAVDYVLRIITTDMRAYDDFLRDQILAVGLVSDVQSRIVVRNVKSTTALPLSLVSPYVQPPA